MTDRKRVEELEKAIRDHRATKTPASWSDADIRLYGKLPEVSEATKKANK